MPPRSENEPSAAVRAAEQVFAALRMRTEDIGALAAGEVRLAAAAVRAIVLLVVLAAAALLVAWVLLVACVLDVFASSSLGWHIPALCLSLGHVLLAWRLWRATSRLGRDLTLPELRATLGRSRAVGSAPGEGSLVARRA